MWPMKKIMHFCKLSDNALRSKEMTNDDFFVSLFYCYWSHLARTKKPYNETTRRGLTTWQEEEAQHLEVDGWLVF